MNTTKKRITNIALATSLLLAFAAAAAAAAGGSPFDRLGITSVECDCSFKVDAGGTAQRWVFHAEPRVKSVDRRGPAAGRLEPGDYIVAIDGKLIVTGEGGRRFSAVAAGEPVVLTVRRGTRVFDEEFVPRRVDSQHPFDVSGFRFPDDERWLDLTREAEELSRLAVELEKLRFDKLPEIPAFDALEGMDSLFAGLDLRLEGLDALDDMNFDGLAESLRGLELELEALQDASPAGSFGMGISFDGSIRRNGDEDGFAEWTFEEPPVVTTVEFGSPAARAGLRSGDVLAEIDGVALDSREGGERFSRITPGQSVEFTYERDGREDTVTMTAVERPESRRRVRGLGCNVGRREPAQFSMTLGGTRFEVHSSGSVHTRTDDDDVVVIETPDGTFELRRVRE